MNDDKIISSVLASVSTFIGLTQIQTLLGILLTLINIGIIIYNLAYKLYSHIKNKDVEKITQDLQDTYNQLEKLQDEIKENKEDED